MIGYKQAHPLLTELALVPKADRVKFFSDKKNFIFFWYYHFAQNFISELAPFHGDWIDTLLNSDKSILLEAFRGSLKTELVKVYVTYCICYQIEPYIVVQSYDSSGSEEMVRNIAKMLVSSTIISDYGMLFPFAKSKDDMSKKSITNFDTTNGVKVVSRSLGEKLRGASSFDEDSGSSRPTLLILDDIDVIDSVRNKDIIDKNEQKINNETIGAMSKERSRIIFLGNTILGDGIVRRFYKSKINSPFWKVFRQPLYSPDGNIVWDFFTNDTIEKIKADEGESAFEQNYLLIPKVLAGMPVFEQEYQDKVQIQPVLWEENGFKFYLDPTDELVIGIDVSEGGEKSDFMTISARKRNGKVAFQFKDRVDESILAEKLNWVLNYSKNGKKYKGVILPENNTGLALINEMKKYSYFQYVLKSRSIDDTSDDNIREKYGFRMSATSKDLIIKEYKIGIFKYEIWITEDVFEEIKTYQFDKNNRPNAIKPDHDDLLVADMIAYHGILHEHWVARESVTEKDIEDMGHLERLKYRIQRGDYMEN